MANTYFHFKQFTIHQDRCAMKVTTDGCLFGAWVAEKILSREWETDKQKSKVKREKCSESFLDIGTGTGLLSLMLAQADPELCIDAIEIDKDAFEQAKENIITSPRADNMQLIYGNAKEFPFTKKYDGIISNPPFYEKELRSGSHKKNTAHHDEGLVLDELLAIIKENLQPGGAFYLLLPYKRNEEIGAACEKNELVVLHKTLVKQSTLHGYFRVMIEGTHSGNKIIALTTDEIVIRDDKQEYTIEFRSLLKDYYLYL